MIGRELSHFDIVEKLGEGGMGSVWKARDTRLNRLVAIKVLDAEKIANPSRKQRFVQEAQAASALNHPNIVVIHEIASADDMDFIVMEYVEGAPLDRRIPRHGMALGELLDIAIQIADALAKAHAAHIIHRDLKPGNIMVTNDGRVKLLDFGLAKLAEPGLIGEDEPTRTVKPPTEEGVILGTLCYMSPEQAEAKLVDARSDVFSFGAVLYEMATGTRAFHGGSKVATLSAILREDPRPPGAISRGIPHDLEKIISRCLRKDPARRFQDVADVKVALQDLKEESESGTLEAPLTRRRGLPLVPVLGALCLLALTAGFYFWRSSPKPPPAPRVVPITSYGSAWLPSFSPDGAQIAFAWDGGKEKGYDIYVKLVDGGTALRLTNNPTPINSLQWSPDGRWIAFGRPGTGLFLISPIGGPERKVMDQAMEAGWMPDGKSLVVSRVAGGGEAGGLVSVPVGAGEAHRLSSTPETSIIRFPTVSPEGRNLAFVRGEGGRYDIFVMPLKGGAQQRLTKDGRFIWGMAWANNREIVFGSTRSGTRAFWRITADGRSEPELVLGIQGEAMFPAIFRSAKGLSQLAYTRYTSDYNISKMEVNVDDRNAPRITTPPATVIASKANDHSPRLSPDGKRIAFESDRSGYREIWVSSIDGANPVQLTTFQSSYTGAPSWSPDGQWIAFESVKAAKGDLYVVSAAGGAPKRLTTDRLDAARPNWSQDGRWIYFRANRGGRLQIWKISVSDPSPAAVQVTSDGWDAMESPDRKLLYFTKPESLGLWSVPLAGGPESRVIDAAFPGYWSIAENGIYFVDWMGRQASSKIQFFSFSSQKVVSIITIAKRIRYTAPGLSVTRDGRWIAWDQPDREEDDVMLLENFR